MLFGNIAKYFFQRDSSSKTLIKRETYLVFLREQDDGKQIDITSEAPPSERCL